MKLAFQTICWDDRIKPDAWPQVFAAVKAAGFDGVEVFQHPNQLPSWVQFHQVAKDSGIEILGLTGGSLRDRAFYLREGGDPGKLPYLYTEGWKDNSPERNEAEFELKQGFTLALHYHHLSKLSNVGEAIALLDRWRPEAGRGSLQWLPDTAHLFIGQQSTDVLIQLIKAQLGRTIAVHLKDWQNVYGRFSHRYARGFCVLGDGQVGIEKILDELKQAGYGGWLVVELDYAAPNADETMWKAAGRLRDWNTKNKWNLPFPQLRESRPPSGVSILEADDHRSKFPAELLLELATRGDLTFYHDLASILRQKLNGLACAVCLPSSSASTLEIVALAHEENLRPGEKQVREIALLCAKEQRAVSDEFGGGLKALAVPIKNRYNPNHIRMVLVFLCAEMKGCFPREVVDSRGFRRAVSDALDIHVTECSLVASAQASYAASTERSRQDFLKRIAEILKSRLSCEGVTVFVKEPARQALVEGGSTGLEWKSQFSRISEQQYEIGKGRTGTAAANRSYSIYQSTEEGREELRLGLARSEESVSTPTKDYCMIAPFFSSGDDVAGVVRCRNKVSANGEVIFFSEEDLAVVEAVMKTAEPALEIMDEQRHLADAVNLLAHECLTPVFALRGYLVDVELDLQIKRPLRAETFPDLKSWVELMFRQVSHFELFIASKQHEWKPDRSIVKFFGDLVAPIVSQAHMLLRQRGFSSSGIDYSTLDDWTKLPYLYVDRNMFEQVVFNLLSNAIKYAHRDPKLFDVKIRGERIPTGVRLTFEDQGMGVPEGWEKDIFLQYVRVDSTERQGRGIGLWVVDRVVTLHGGKVYLDRSRPNTTFVIDLPMSCIAQSGRQPRTPV